MSKYGEELYLMNWVNTYLPHGQGIKSFATDFSDGTTFVRFLERLSGKKCNTKMLEPKNEIFRLQNCKVGIDMARTMVSKLMIDGRNLISGQDYDVKLIVGFIFDLVLHYQVNEIELSDDDGQQFTGKNALLEWAKRKSRNDKMGICIKDFKSGWNDGLAFMQIANSYDNGVFDLEKQKGKGSELENNKDRINTVIQYFEQKYDVPRIIDGDFAENQNERACITYLSSLYKALKNQTGGQAVQQLIKHIKDVKNAYQQLTNAQNSFEKICVEAEEKIKQFHTGTAEDVAQIQKQLDDIRKCYKIDIHELKKALLSVEEAVDLVQDLLGSYQFSTQSKILQIDQQRLDSKKYSINVDNYSTSTLNIIQNLEQIIADKKMHGQSLRIQYWADLFQKFSSEGNITRENLEKLLISIDMQFYLEQLLLNNQQSIGKDDFIQKMLQIESQSANEEQVTNTFNQLLQDRKINAETVQLFKLNEEDQKYLLELVKQVEGNGESAKLVQDLFRKQ